MRKTGVLAATPVDTSMGIEQVRLAGADYTSRYLSETPAEQSELQILHKDTLTALVIDAAHSMHKEGADSIFIYCNSLAGAIHLEQVRRDVPLPVVTPLDTYRTLATRYDKIGVLAANCQSLAAIERVIRETSPPCSVFGAAILPVVEAVENQVPPARIVDSLGVGAIIHSLCAMGAETVVLGCTHFPYFAQEVQAICQVPIVNPASHMLKMLEL